MEQTGQASPVQTPHHEVSKRTATLIVVLFAFTIFGAAALLAHPAGQELLGVRVESMSSKASVSDSETQYDCIAAPCGTEETKDEPVINCIKAPCPGGELAIVTTELPAATAGMAYSHQLEVSGGSAPYKWSINNTAMSGIEIKPTTGEVFGAPKVGTHKITVKVIDAAGVAVSRLFTFQVNEGTIQTAHPAGSLVLGLDNIPTSVYVIVEQGGRLMRVGFPNAETFLSHGYKWEKIVRGNAADQALPVAAAMSLAEGSLVQNRDNVRGAVYVVYPNRMIRGFTSEEVFKQMGYSYSMVHTTDITQYTEGTPIATVEEHAPGTDIVDARTSSVYRIMGSNAKLAYPTAAIYNTWHTYNYDFSRVIPMNEFDRQIEVVGTMQNR